ncbi:hypothetical protein [Lichenifustis flavocetrariae]|uniref:Uncharacterized protein n=1 Tax=Lichenifustis flavocetrariae TaxID=2949735 RepID=A0AA41YUC6_9HYPH|nr:hypothetical protein [Lichenifustis flavocetrariae]MCW6508729.1 hypothetical protein [Lichenifustis flavocetrariae]
MPDAQKLKRFHIEQDGEDFLLRIEDEAGDLFEVTATHDQVDLIVDSLDEALEAEEEAEDLDDDADEEEKA